MSDLRALRRAVLSVLVAGMGVGMGSTAWAAGNVQNGKAMAQEQCSNCHIVAKNDPNAAETANVGPDFMAIKGLTAATLKAKLNKPHPVMSKFPQLNDRQIDDIVAYIGSLKS